MKIGVIVFSLLLIICKSFAIESNNYYDNTFVGEWSDREYLGPYAPEFELSSRYSNLQFKDDIFFKGYLNSNINDELFDLSLVWNSDINAKYSCPDFYLNEHISYIRYLFRLIVISYGVEFLKESYKSLTFLGEKIGSCEINWDAIFAECNPKSLEMQKFLKRLKHGHLMNFDLSSLNKKNEKEIGKWIKGILNKNEKDIVQSVVEFQCSKRPSSCKSISKNSISKIVNQSCEHIKTVIKNGCSEVDTYYGLSYIPEALDLIKKSNTLSVINTAGYGSACLARYIDNLKNKEFKDSMLQLIFTSLYKKMMSSNVAYPQGESFLPGALKEFDDKGLADFLFVAPTPTIVATPVVVETVVPKVVPTVIAPTPTPTPVIVKVVKPTPTPTPIPTPKISYFQMMTNKFQQEKPEFLVLDMDLFKLDFTFSKDLIEKWDRPLKRFQSRIALEDMKKFDKLGSKTEPVLLKFLKYLIDQNNHQGLYNIQMVLGEEFWIVNDIDDMKDPVFIRLRNDETTSNRWTIILQNPIK